MRKFALGGSLIIAGALGCGDVHVSVDGKKDQTPAAETTEAGDDEGFSLQIPNLGVDVQGKDGKWDVKAPGTDVKVGDGKVDVQAPGTNVNVDKDGVRVKAPNTDVEVK